MKNGKGFTLIEILIVIGIIGILSAIAFPNFTRYREIYVMKGEIQKVVSFINLAKSASLRHNDQIGLIFPSGEGINVTMFVDSNRNNALDTGETVLNRLNLDSGLTHVSNTAKYIGIPPTGVIIGSNTTLTFQYGNQTRRVIISGYGRVRVEK